jgi:hypothetical protein
MKADARRTLVLLALVCIAPIVAGYAAFYFWKPERRTNYGELIKPAPWKPEGLSSADIAPLRGRWVMAFAAPAQCDTNCRDNLWIMRQVRTAQGKEMDRVERVWLVTDGGRPDPALLAEHPGLRVVEPRVPALEPGRIQLVDPLGNLMMRYPAEPEPKRMLKDFERILKYSRI